MGVTQAAGDASGLNSAARVPIEANLSQPRTDKDEATMSADRHRAVRREKQKRAKDIKREVKKQIQAACAAAPAQPTKAE